MAEQENKLIESLEAEAEDLPVQTRHQIWSMLLRGGAVLVFKAWLGKVKNEEDCLDTTQFDELSDLLFIKTCPHELAEHLQVDPNSTDEHVFLMYEDEVYLDRFNSLETAALFVDLGVYDATFLSLRDDRVAEYLISKGYVTQEQIDELQSALNPMFCTDVTKNRIILLNLAIYSNKKTSDEVFLFCKLNPLHFLFFNIQGIDSKHRLGTVLYTQLTEDRCYMRLNRSF